MSRKKHPYYDPSPILSYNATYNFIVGGRGIGKTYGFKHRAIRDFFKHGREFIVLRRYSTELGTRHAFFDDVHPRFPNYDFRVYGMYGQVAPLNVAGCWWYRPIVIQVSASSLNKNMKQV